ncbi:hypothetical protein BKM15_18330 [Pseudomonas syringae pv. syringae]|nr:hypothetical protein BKM15_18330 [Pseudomonas syringae pv. syringae]
MATTVREVLAQSGALGYIVGILVAFQFALKLLKLSFDFHNEHLAQRKFKRLKELSAYAVEGSLPHEFLKTAAGVEIFKITTKIDTSPNKAKALMTAHSAGSLTLADMKVVAKSIDVAPSGLIVVNIPLDKKVAAYAGATLSWMLFIYCTFVMAYLGATGEPQAQMAGFFVMLCGTLLARGIYTEFRHLKKIKNLRSQLEADPLVLT